MTNAMPNSPLSSPRPDGYERTCEFSNPITSETAKPRNVGSWQREFLHEGSIYCSSTGRGVLGWGNHRRSDHAAPDAHSFYVPSFFERAEGEWRCPEFYLGANREAIRRYLTEYEEPVPHISWKQYPFEQFAGVFADLKGRIETGQLEKAVPVIYDEAALAMNPSLLAFMITHLLESTVHDPITVYGSWNADEGFLGATPELFFEKKGTALRTQAVAGTISNDRAVEELVSSAKDQREHRYVVDGIASSLADLGELNIGETKPLRLSRLTHLQTPLHLQLEKNCEVSELKQRLHPTPALGGVPRQESYQWLQGLQKYGDRKQFGAPFGVTQFNESVCCVVGIRAIHWSKDQMKIWAGCGVVAESEVEREWDELRLKIDSIKSRLGLNVSPRQPLLT